MSTGILLLSQVKFLIVPVLNKIVALGIIITQSKIVARRIIITQSKIVARRIIITQSFLIIGSSHPRSNYTKEIVCSRQLCLHYLLLALFYTKIRL
jgi:hypothetical protein